MKYLKNLSLLHVGAIKNLKLNAEFDGDENPKPIVLIGKNGAGKTTMLTTIVDALTELQATAGFQDITGISIGGGRKYFRVSGGTLIHHGESKCLSSITFGKALEACLTTDWIYTDKVGKFDIEEWLTGGAPKNLYVQNDTASSKNTYLGVIDNKPQHESAKAEFINSAYVYFPAHRNEKPFWSNTDAHAELPSDGKNRFSNQLSKPLVCTQSAEQTANWLLDAILDDLASAHSNQVKHFNSLDKVYPNGVAEVASIKAIFSPINLIAFSNANLILSTILGYSARFAVSPRNNNKRLHYMQMNAENPQSLHISHLSHGQSSLLSIFCTIMRYSDTLVGQTKKLDEITGVAIIDEADAGLHIKYQKEVFPRLMKLMPKVQFILTTHSPLMLLGIENEYGQDGIQIIEVPSGDKVNAETFSEFGDAFEVFENTDKFKSTIQTFVSEADNKPLLFVEGESDQILIEAAWSKLRQRPFPFKCDGKLGDKNLRLILSDIVNNQREVSKPICCLWDFDNAYSDWTTLISTNKKDPKFIEAPVTEAEGLYFQESSGKHIYGALLPVPTHRQQYASKLFKDRSKLSIEFLFSDTVLKKHKCIKESQFPGNGTLNELIASTKKIDLANKLATEDVAEFSGFEPLLSMCEKLLLHKTPLA
jgi:predicted ATPase